MKKLAIVTTHPIQYYAPVFKLLNQRTNIGIKVFYTWGQAALTKYDPGFDKDINWDIPLLDGYDYELMENTATDPGSHHFNGIANPDLIKQIEAFKADAVLMVGWAYKSHLKAIRHFYKKVPVYFRGDSNLLDDQPGIRSLAKSIFLKWIYSHISHAFYVGANNLAYYKKYGLTNNQLSFAPHAVDNDRFGLSRKSEVAELRLRLQIPTDAILILFAGKFEEKKSPSLSLEAFKQLNDDKAHLLFVGSGELEKDLKTGATSIPNIHFMDFANQNYMPVIYQACDLFCLPSKGPNETWGLAVNEAMACGKAVLVSDKCGCAIDLVTKSNGIIFNSQNLDELVLGLAKLTTDKTALAHMGKQSAIIINDWNFTNIALAIENKLVNEKD